MDGVQLPQGYRTTNRRQFTFYHFAPNSLINLRRMKSWVDLGATQGFWIQDNWIKNPAP